MKFLFRPIKRNAYSRKGNLIQYLVIHDTGNSNKGAGALAHRNYVENNTRGASAHYFVDDKVIVQYVGDSLSAGSVGDGKGKYGITNANSLSIEMCINSDADYAKTYKNTVELTKNLMRKFNIPLDRVVRHYDASRKNCPGHMSKNNWKAWWQFKEDIQKPIEWQIDLSKDSEFGNDDFITQIANSIEGQKLNVLPSVTIAQAILESNWGKSDLAINGKNLFGIKDSKEWKGEIYTKKTKEQDSLKTYTITANFRKYGSWLESIQDHDKFFISTPWRVQNYQRVLKSTNYKEQAQALQACGYATDREYANKLINLIEKYNLQKFDKGVIKMENKPSKWAEKDWQWGIDNKITDGTNPQGLCTREQVVAMIKRAKENESNN
ncbi:Flagellum-specific peptidoglycan hydrolase FlgJ [Peptoniphilus asaccharolyticus DSM 20463]|uniref:Flagellum-specific peptidoglycan hydrolase FlgJ n=1 Tax=Peptoniphilus asaccharolyticus DSM 20463 TaxID=573058 RepID=A0A1W1UYN8_PEPAS|nr:glucosaminidase domain-containing protein [Peptoniphilus asaccharolyticus]MBL7575357.1 glucosaminidase domain-containing protein [Peptoniphilus asaccharolyticus]SMB86186.1 Flagellum-specific peptidoglycan hydrolase FlgJ [Peptoniphilus asaccharolyticus DSM 20463]